MKLTDFGKNKANAATTNTITDIYLPKKLLICFNVFILISFFIIYFLY